MTAEDPVEFNLRGINQVQIREASGLSFAVVLREFLRQDPNIILVGEIRDYETAEIAVKAALTGHLVLSTLHTNDAPVDGVAAREHGHRALPGGHRGQPHPGAAAGEARLRRLQDGRHEGAPLPEPAWRPASAREELRSLRVHRGRGCAACNGTGYKGRVGLYEVMEMTEAHPRPRDGGGRPRSRSSGRRSRRGC